MFFCRKFEEKIEVISALCLCDNCLLNIHQDCEEECQLCRDIASKVDTRKLLKM